MSKDEARSLTKAYNNVYELNIPNEIIEESLNQSNNGIVVIDDLLKNLSKINLNSK
jgi:hypothetical protein